MKLQTLAIIFVIIILPISLVLASYTKARVETINIQAQYDSKLNDATHDALKAYQLNSFTSDTSDYTNSKIRDIKGSVNTFFNSLSTNFNTLGYTKETLQNYVPALVYTMYDGYYIYSPYKNTWGTESTNPDINAEISEQITNQNTYSENQKLYGLKPYVYYSCRYKKGDIDVVITYSLDNYIQIQGKIGSTVISKYGYLLSNVNVNGDNIYYNGISITPEDLLTERTYVDENITQPLQYQKKNGTKYYRDNNGIFSVLNGRRQPQNIDTLGDKDDNAKKYYKEAYNLKEFICNSGLIDLTTADIVDINTGNKYVNGQSPYYSINGRIFDFDNSTGISIESETSNFNTHRIDVIKNSIERNLSIAISNFNNYSVEVPTEFQMPKLKDSDWDKIMDNISVISFFQGANIGGKVYNGYSIITNTKNEDVVMEDSIYIKNKVTQDIYNITEEGLTDGIDSSYVGIFNINTEKRVGKDGTTYFLPVEGTLSYNSIITKNSISDNFNGNISEYIENLSNEWKKIYYTALGRERYGLYRQKLEI